MSMKQPGNWGTGMKGFRAATILVIGGLAVSTIGACKQKSRVSHRGRMASAPEGGGTAADAGGALEKISASVANGFPDRFRRELARNPEWHHLQLGGLDQSQSDTLGDTSNALLMVGSRIWRPKVQDGMAVSLDEITSEKSRLVVDTRTGEGRVKWVQGKVDLAAPGRRSDWVSLALNLDDVVLDGAPGSGKSGVNLSQKSGNSNTGTVGDHVVNLRTAEGRKSLLQRIRDKEFTSGDKSNNVSKGVSKGISKSMSSAEDDLIKGELEFLFWQDGRIGFKEGNSLHVFRKRIPLPAMAAVTPAQRKLNVFVAPFMMAEDLKSGFAPLQVDDMTLPSYAHHNTSVAKDVLLDKDFPDSMVPYLERSLASWDQVLGVQYFKIRKSGRKLDSVDCMTLSSVCVFWNGHEGDISAAGIGGVSFSTYDPLTGVIDGGSISFMNLEAAGTTPTAMPPQALSDMLTGKSINARAAAEWQAKTQELGNYRHPAPESNLVYVMTHEFGHYLGLRHNFAGSVYARPGTVTSSVMEYPPYPVRSGTAGVIGLFDIATINAIYGRGGSDGEETRFCTDRDAQPVADPRIEGQFTKMAQCVLMDYGDPVQWWMTMTEVSENGTLTAVPGSEALKMIRLFTTAIRTVDNIAEQLGFFLRPGTGATPQQAEAVRAFLCGRPVAERVAVEEQLARDMGVQLRCN